MPERTGGPLGNQRYLGGEPGTDERLLQQALALEAEEADQLQAADLTRMVMSRIQTDAHAGPVTAARPAAAAAAVARRSGLVTAAVGGLWVLVCYVWLFPALAIWVPQWLTHLVPGNLWLVVNAVGWNLGWLIETFTRLMGPANLAWLVILPLILAVAMVRRREPASAEG